MCNAFSVASSRCGGSVVATHNMVVSINSKLHLPPRLNPIILAAKADASPVGVRYKLPP
ncbi:hypothetical protein [Bradyrhizobium sp. WSM2254]|uniref:hypothetical protein n=1 Tax=Bradyrhizobium sp. WSM2254 TaxID=1188263 RepID=UPI00041272BF|nr:hypothetical protein [Bradyrhizobium sp. WSM2254]